MNGKKIPEDRLAQMMNLDKQILSKHLTTILEFGIASVDPTTGALVNRRMLRDEHIRSVRSEAGKLGGNPHLPKQKLSKPETKVKQTPSKSQPLQSSSSDLQYSYIDADKKLCEGKRLHGIPESVAVVIAYGSTIHPKVPESACRAFWAHYEGQAKTDPDGNLFWITSGDTVVTNWKIKLPQWQEKNYGSIDKPNQKGFDRNKGTINEGRGAAYRDVGKVG